MVTDWQAMEHFYYTELSWLFIISAIGFVVLLSIIWDLKLKLPRMVAAIICAVWALCAVRIVYNVGQHGVLHERSKQENPAIRTYRVFLFEEYRPYNRSELLHYRQGDFRSNFEAIGLYEAHPVQQEITYAGRDQWHAYLGTQERFFTVPIDLIIFQDDASVARREGHQYVLRDLEMETIGFISPSAVFLDRYVVPEALRDLWASSEVVQNAHRRATTQEGWVLPK